MSTPISFQHDLEMEVTCSVAPAERATGQSGYSLGYPGCPAAIEDLCVTVIIAGESIEITKDLPPAARKRVEALIWKAYDNYDPTPYCGRCHARKQAQCKCDNGTFKS